MLLHRKTCLIPTMILHKWIWQVMSFLFTNVEVYLYYYTQWLELSMTIYEGKRWTKTKLMFQHTHVSSSIQWMRWAPVEHQQTHIWRPVSKLKLYRIKYNAKSCKRPYTASSQAKGSKLLGEPIPEASAYERKFITCCPPWFDITSCINIDKPPVFFII